MLVDSLLWQFSKEAGHRLCVSSEV